MKTINLRDYYPFYTQDTFLEVSDTVAEALAEAERQEHNYLRRLFYNKAHYSMDAEDGIEATMETSAIECHMTVFSCSYRGVPPVRAAVHIHL